MAPQSGASSSRSKPLPSSSALQSIPSPSTEMDAALRRTHPTHFIRAALDYLPTVSSSSANIVAEKDVNNYGSRTTTRIAALLFGALALGVGYHLTEGRSLVSLSARVVAFTMFVTLVYQLLGGGKIGHRSFREQGRFLCEAATADVLCDAVDGAQALWSTYASVKQRVLLISGTVVVSELLGVYLTAGRLCVLIGVVLVALAAAGGRKW
ncbi:transmembrane protein, putative [Bodo saltans]|uniref:Transmembrane protein, putative n=1 Tax=Bodo saltans TaxID=75058 RepID=A0A0S4J6E5_BODSA|nr:transmembrane protein, putative [Bodo saltans]|eukprot:CUG85617.1 transmembrane protein, putative [Bodo saltans]